MFCDISDKLKEPFVRQILSCCLGDSSEARIERALTEYEGEQFYGWLENGEPVAVCGFRVLADKVEICHIAVVENTRRKGIGRAIVAILREKYNMTIEAETDDDAVEFYRKCGFETTALYKEYDGEKYRRWTCVLDKDKAFWLALDKLVAESKLVIDRPKGTCHPKYPNFVYPLDYGYLEGTSSMDGGAIDVWRGTDGAYIDAIVITVDLLKKDSEIKILIGCTEDEKQTVIYSHNSEYMKGILVRRSACE
jgi:inorganic pyrophosphatase